MIDTILNYVWFVFKLLALCIILSIPILVLIYIFKGWFNRSKKSFLFKLFIITYLISLIGVCLIYFIPTLQVGLGDGYTFWNYVVFILLHLLWFIFINILITGIIIIFGLLTKGIYDYFLRKNKKEKKTKKSTELTNINIKYLWISLIITWIIVFIVYLVFPKLIAMILYLIYLT
jgi:hypothetical protein